MNEDKNQWVFRTRRTRKGILTDQPVFVVKQPISQQHSPILLTATENRLFPMELSADLRLEGRPEMGLTMEHN